MRAWPSSAARPRTSWSRKLGRAMSWRSRVAVMALTRSRRTAARSKSRSAAAWAILRLEPFYEIAAFASEKQDGFGHRLAVGGLGHQPGAGPQAVRQLILQAGAGAGRQAPLLAGADPKRLLHDLQGLPGHAAGGVGAEIEGPVRVKPPDEPEGREVFLQVKAEAEIILVIPEHDVVAGPVLLDEVALQDEGFPARGGEDHVHLGHFLEHQGGLGVVLLRGLEVGSQAVLQVHRFPDVEHPAAGVLEQVDAAAPGGCEAGPRPGPDKAKRALHRAQTSYITITGRTAMSRRVRADLTAGPQGADPSRGLGCE